MNPIVPPIAKFLTAGTILADIAIVAYVIGWLVGLAIKPITALRNKAIEMIAPYARILGFLLALSAMAGSLFYSEIAKYPPCFLCWWQRIFMYPQVLLIAMGIMKDDKKVADYTIAMSIIGFVISVYQYYIQMGGGQLFQCDLNGGVSCTQHFPLEFGYVTLPMMGLTAFAGLIILMWISKKHAK
ncbi:MAG TPA: disulfide bond formation protein B [Patescibacteria group bacterium]|nr:disulfide bond formation protein B [Patescibacteria group bacterium]